MRIPRDKIYRAFPELDRFSDEQCRMLMDRIKLQGQGWEVVWLVTVGVSGAAFLMSCFVVPALMRAAGLETDRGRHETLALFCWMLTLTILPAAAGLFTRDALLRRYLTRAIQVRLDRVRCPGCKYVLIGQRPFGGRVECPECGRVTRLSELAITEADLIPPRTEEGKVSEEDLLRP